MPKAVKRIPERRCCGCGVSKAGREMIRIVRTPEGVVMIDDSGKANGRGAYICSDPACIARAEKKGTIGRSLKAETEPSLFEDLRKRCSGLETG